MKHSLLYLALTFGLAVAVPAAMAADPRAVTPVIGTHNLFDIAFALEDWAGSGRPGMPPFCLAGGLANHVARTLGELGCRVTLTYGVIPAGQDAAASRHLLDLVHKLSRPGSFFSAGYDIDPQSLTWGRLHREFTESLTPPEEQPTDEERDRRHRARPEDDLPGDLLRRDRNGLGIRRADKLDDD